MRHSVELRLKGSIQELGYIAELKGLKLTFDLTGSHDIGNIWAFFKEQSESIDKRYTKINNSIDSTICDIAAIDPTGQTFRYPVNRESQKHLTEVASINFLTLREKFSSLENHLEELHQLNTWLKSEYAQRTFTKTLSRCQIYRIARELPARSEWQHQDFNDTKQKLRNAYNISNKELSKAIDLIQNHYNLAPLIDKPLPIKGISSQQILEFIDVWAQQNQESINPSSSADVYSYLDLADCMLSELQERIVLRRETEKKFNNQINADYLAGLSALFYFSYDREFSEYYSTIFELELNEKSKALSNDEGCAIDIFMHLFDKTNAMQNIVTSLYSLEHSELAETILSKHRVAEELGWVEQARNRTHTLYPQFADY